MVIGGPLGGVTVTTAWPQLGVPLAGLLAPPD
jgi:hypothetical protein